MRNTLAPLFRAATGARTASRAVTAATWLAISCGLGGCASGGAPGGGTFAMAGSGATVAFESIDGPPPQVFERMVNVLDSESKLRNLSIVSREGSASYRVRSYLSAQVSRGRATIAWVWDVYDRDQQRALRLSGERTYSRAVQRALTEFVLKVRARRILDLAGSGLWEGNLSEMRRDWVVGEPKPKKARRGSR